ncbi:thioredoxin family protein [Aliarcobacter cibarius]|uniref:Thioredoxin n=1 Tax=Aliarcobacter cibarius TaxID=255507 RepID=A0ABY2V745_9BACT|nr:thioredoxin domain-containing protein [Aliarcobacter cibarius]TLT01860.1 redoxin domain-containing protein [Aliarcobacter cibarius]TLT02195.1 redoxin domain-containing protein [Aliarcobacter cibarius]
MRKYFFVTLLTITSLFSYEELTADNFDQKIKGKNVIIDFYAPWCPPCKVLANNLEDFEIQKPDNVEIFKVNIDNEVLLAKKYKVKKLPTIVYFKDGKEVKQEFGIRSVEELLETSKKEFN